MEQERSQIQSLTQPNQINRGRSKAITQRTATVLVLLSSILPFLNNILKNIFDTESILLINAPGVKKLDLDSAIFFLAMPVSYLFIAIGGRLGAHKSSYYAVFVSCYLQLFLIVNFLFIEKKKAYFITQIALFVICVVIAVLYFLKQRYYKTIEEKNEFLNTTLDRYSSILREKK